MSLPITKNAQVLALIKNRDYKKALAIAKTFVRDFNKEEQRIIQIAHETLTGNGAMFKMLGTDTDKIILEAKELLNKFLKKRT